MRPHGGRIQQQTAGFGERFGVQLFPQTLPDPARLPTTEAHINGVPVSQLGRQIPPRSAGAIEMEHRFQELPIAQFRRRARRRMFRLRQSYFELFPHRIVNQFSHFGFGHPKFQSPHTIFVHTIIREHALV